MGWFDKAKKIVKKASEEIEEATTETIEGERKYGNMREHKGVPMKDNWKRPN